MDYENDSIADINFGIVLAILFIIFGMHAIPDGEVLDHWLFFAAIITLLISILAPGILRPLNKLWIEIGLKMGAVMTPVTMLVIYVITIIPTGFILKILSKDPLRLKFDKKAGSYWINRTEKEDLSSSMKNQF